MAELRFQVNRPRIAASALAAACLLLLHVQVSHAAPPVVTNPGDQINTEGDTGIMLPIVAFDPDGDPLSFSATDLPPRLDIDPVTGVISEDINVNGAAGTHDVTVDVSAAGDTTSIQFSWFIIPGVLGSGQILREFWTGIPGDAISDLTSSPAYPDSPTGSNFLTSFVAPSGFGESYGTRVRGYVHPPFTGDYRFWIAADDTAELWLSTDDLPASATLIASVPSPTGPQQWNLHPSQQSILIPLVAGERYYIEALHKENSGADHLAVAWEIPGSAQAVIDGLYLSPLDFAPTVDPIPDQGSHEGDSVSLAVTATDPNGDPVTYSAIGLPPQLSIDPVTGLIAGSVDPGVGSYAVTVMAQDPAGGIGSTDFTWYVVPADATLVVPVNKGVACQDSATGTGYLMYSQVPVRLRFKPNLVPSQNAEHFVCVKKIGGVWHHDDNDGYFPFRIWETDVLVAAVDFDADTVTDLAGQFDFTEGIIRGYESGDLAFIADQYGGVPANGEFEVTGSYFYPDRFPTYPPVPVPVGPAWSRVLLLALLLASGILAVRGPRSQI